MKHTYTLMMLAKNEIDGLKVVGPRIKNEWLDEILVVDGGSTDGTQDYCRSLGWTVYQQKGIGIVPGLREGFLEASGDVIICYTPDNNMIPEKIPEIIAKMEEGYDMVCCSRYKDGAKSDDDHIISAFGNWMFTTLLDLCFHADYTDVLGFYRAFRKALLDELNITVENSISAQLSIRCKKAGKKVIDIPGDEPPRIGGKTSRRIIYHGLIELRTIFHELFDEEWKTPRQNPIYTKKLDPKKSLRSK